MLDPELYDRLPWWKKAFVHFDQENDRQFSYHGPPLPAPGVLGELWLKAALHGEVGTPYERAAHYCQSQESANKNSGGVECVTTSAVIVRNIVKDHLAKKTGLDPIDDLEVREFVDASNQTDLSGWKIRLPSSLPVVGGFMHPVLQLPKALDYFKDELGKQYNSSFAFKITSYNSPESLIDNLQKGYPILIHGVWPKKYINPYNGNFQFDIAIPLGGIPHTMPLVMYSAGDVWWFYNLGWDPKKGGDKFYRMSTPDLAKFWGRH